MFELMNKQTKSQLKAKKQINHDTLLNQTITCNEIKNAVKQQQQ